MTPAARWLIVTLIVGAARADALPDELADLRQMIPPLLSSDEWTPADVIGTVQRIMPEDWAPSGPWRTQILALLPPDQAELVAALADRWPE